MKCTVDKLRAREQLLWRSRLLILHISLNHYGPYVTPPDSPAPLQTKATESPCCTDSGAAAALSPDLWCVQLQVAEAERGVLIGTSRETCGVNDDAKCQVRWRVSWRSCRFLFLVQRTEKKKYTFDQIWHRNSFWQLKVLILSLFTFQIRRLGEWVDEIHRCRPGTEAWTVGTWSVELLRTTLVFN